MRGVYIWLEEDDLNFAGETPSVCINDQSLQNRSQIAHTRFVGGGMYVFLGLPPVIGLRYGPDLL